MTVRELITKLGFSFDGKGADQYTKKISDIKFAGVSLGAVLKTAMAGVSVAAIKSMVQSTIEYGDELGNSAKITGIAVEQLYKLRFAAKLANVSQEELNSSLVIFSTKLADAKEGQKDAVKAFSDRGIKASEIKDTNQAFDLVAQSLTKMKDGFEKTAAARTFFGRGGGRLVALFQKDSGELAKFMKVIDAFGGGPTKKFTDASERIDDRLQVLKQIFPRLRNTIVESFYPAIEGAQERLMDWIIANKEFIKLKTDETIKGLGKAFHVAGVFVETLYKGFSFGIESLKQYPKVLFALSAGFGVLLTTIFPITVALAAVALILEDLDAYSKGNKSFLGPFIDGAIDKFHQLRHEIHLLKEEYAGLFSFFKTTGELIGNVFGSGKIPTNIQARIDSLNGVSAGGNTVSPSQLKTLPSNATQVVSAGGTVSNNTTIKSSPSVTVNVTGTKDMDGKALADKVSEEVSKTLVNHYRTAFQNAQGIENR